MNGGTAGGQGAGAVMLPPPMGSRPPAPTAAAERGFRFRGTEVARVECFSDAVFAFALTLLVVSLEVPRSFDELLERMRGFPVFALCFAMLMHVWYQHHRFFRRYGLEDPLTITLNSVLLFVVLFFVYPLKFLFSIVVAIFTSPEARATLAAQMPDERMPLLFTIYGIGAAALYGMIAVLHGRALGRAAALGLTAGERFDTVTTIRENLLLAAVGVASIVVANVVPIRSIGWAGLVYCAIPLLLTPHGMARGRARRRLA